MIGGKRSFRWLKQADKIWIPDCGMICSLNEQKKVGKPKQDMFKFSEMDLEKVQKLFEELFWNNPFKKKTLHTLNVHFHINRFDTYWLVSKSRYVVSFNYNVIEIVFIVRSYQTYVDAKDVA